MALSAAFLDLARRHVGWAGEQTALLDRLVPVGVTVDDAKDAVMHRSGRTLRADVLGTYAVNGTWLWSWGNEGYAGLPGTGAAERLREIGARDGIVEFTERMLDFSDSPDPRQVAVWVALTGMGVLDGRGVAIFAHNERGRTFMMVHDSAVPRARPRPTDLFAGLDNGPGPAVERIRGYVTRHGLAADYRAGRVEVTYPSGNRATVDYHGDRIGAVAVAGPDGGPAVAEADDEPVLGTSTAPPPRTAPSDRQLGRPLLDLAARELAWASRWAAGFDRYAEAELGQPPGTDPFWDERAAVLRFTRGALPCDLLGIHDPRADTWQWKLDPTAMTRLREAAGVTQAPPAELDTARLDLTRYPDRNGLPLIFARAAAGVLPGDGVVETVDPQGRSLFMLVSHGWTPRLDDIDPQHVADSIRDAASLLHPFTPAGDRPRVMRTLAECGLRRLGARSLFIEPELLSGDVGLFQVRVYLSSTGDVIDIGVWSGSRRVG